MKIYSDVFDLFSSIKNYNCRSSNHFFICPNISNVLHSCTGIHSVDGHGSAWLTPPSSIEKLASPTPLKSNGELVKCNQNSLGLNEKAACNTLNSSEVSSDSIL
ncbi:putative iron-sensing transcription factor 1 [Trichinella spiralis]|uniref:putative iron-sensing transcription factor 1 n=1 Tax=Trichinella spiralis TaxID=6334 RepID=UPI0001EFB7E6|nr:putative iron-sensing transcription factor 1 [Trichinella spiralis]